MKFDSNGIYASSEKLKEIALIVLEQEKRDREAADVLQSLHPISILGTCHGTVGTLEHQRPRLIR